MKNSTKLIIFGGLVASGIAAYYLIYGKKEVATTEDNKTPRRKIITTPKTNLNVISK